MYNFLFIFLQVTIVVEKGSGYFYVVPEQRDIVSVDYQEKDKRIQINPLKDGSLSLTVYDLCITMPQPLTASVYVSGVGSVLLSVIDKVSYNMSFSKNNKMQCR